MRCSEALARENKSAPKSIFSIRQVEVTHLLILGDVWKGLWKWKVWKWLGTFSCSKFYKKYQPFQFPGLNLRLFLPPLHHGYQWFCNQSEFSLCLQTYVNLKQTANEHPPHSFLFFFPPNTGHRRGKKKEKQNDDHTSSHLYNTFTRTFISWMVTPFHILGQIYPLAHPHPAGCPFLGIVPPTGSLIWNLQCSSRTLSHNGWSSPGSVTLPFHLLSGISQLISGEGGGWGSESLLSKK